MRLLCYDSHSPLLLCLPHTPFSLNESMKKTSQPTVCHFSAQLTTCIVCVFQVSKVRVQDCSRYRSCSECLGARDPYCGWCSLENKSVYYYYYLYNYSPCYVQSQCTRFHLGACVYIAVGACLDLTCSSRESQVDQVK